MPRFRRLPSNSEYMRAHLTTDHPQMLVDLGWTFSQLVTQHMRAHKEASKDVLPRKFGDKGNTFTGWKGRT